MSVPIHLPIIPVAERPPTHSFVSRSTHLFTSLFIHLLIHSSFWMPSNTLAFGYLPSHTLVGTLARTQQVTHDFRPLAHVSLSHSVLRATGTSDLCSCLSRFVRMSGRRAHRQHLEIGVALQEAAARTERQQAKYCQLMFRNYVLASFPSQRSTY
jgi:hypothetical protein